MSVQASHQRRELTEPERARLSALRERIHAELPDLVARNQLREEARHEPTLSGALRRAVHESRRPIHQIAHEIGIPPQQLDEFLTGERNLFSDVIDRLAKSIGFSLPLQAIPLSPVPRESPTAAPVQQSGS
jgi:hypothetical protein